MLSLKIHITLTKLGDTFSAGDKVISWFRLDSGYAGLGSGYAGFTALGSRYAVILGHSNIDSFCIYRLCWLKSIYRYVHVHSAPLQAAVLTHLLKGICGK